MRRWVIAGILGCSVVVLVLLFFLSSKPAAKPGEAVTFANDCCGTVELSDGKLLLNGQPTVGYTVGTDSKGPYILPNTYVGVVLDQGFAVDGTTSAIKLRLDRLPRPTKIVLYEGLRPYVFTSQEASKPAHAAGTGQS